VVDVEAADRDDSEGDDNDGTAAEGVAVDFCPRVEAPRLLRGELGMV
jgi:hypothetical protein